MTIKGMPETNDEIIKRAITALHRTWQAIAYDMMVVYGPPEKATMRKSQVLDCLMSCGIMTGYPEMYGEDREAVQWLDKLYEVSWKRRDKIGSFAKKLYKEILAKAFPNKTYGA
jgi:hypothetical protein